MAQLSGFRSRRAQCCTADIGRGARRRGSRRKNARTGRLAGQIERRQMIEDVVVTGRKSGR